MTNIIETPVKDQAAHDAAAKVADYEHGWSSDIATDVAPKGLSEDTVRFISAKKNEPEWMLDWRPRTLTSLPLARTVRRIRRSFRRSVEHTSEIQSLMRSAYGVFCLKQKIKHQ